MYTDTTGTFQFVMVENELPEFGTIPNRIGDLTCQQKRFSKISRQKCTRIRQEAVFVLAIERTGQKPIPSAVAV